MDILPPEDIERETLWHLYVDLLQDYEVLQEEKSRLWDIIQRNMEEYAKRLYALENTPLVELPTDALIAKVEPYFARIASALEVSNQLRTNELFIAQKQLSEPARVNTDPISEPLTRSAQSNRASVKRVNGSTNGSAKIDIDPIAVRQFRKKHTVPETAMHFGVSESTIKRTLKGG